jgi:hypothetical protein
MKDNVFSALVEQLEDRFQEMDSDITVALLKSDSEYAALKKRLAELESQFPFMERALEGKGELRLTAEEHAGFPFRQAGRDEHSYQNQRGAFRRGQV